MEQPQANPTFCPQNCGFYGSSQFGGMCSKCFQENVKQRSEANKALSSPSNSYYAASNMPVTSSSSQTPASFATSSSSDAPNQQQAPSQQQEDDEQEQQGVSFSNDQDEIVGRMDEDNINEPLTPTPTTVMMNNSSSNTDNNNDMMAVEQSNSNDGDIMGADMKTPMPDVAPQTNPLLARPLSHSATAPTLPIAIPASLPVTFEPASLGAESMSPSAASAASMNTRKSAGRCISCRKKVGLTGFDCRCGGLFCSTHRYPNEHNCQFDYKEYERKILEGSLKKVVASKVTGI